VSTFKFACLCFALGYIAAVFIGFWPVFWGLIILALAWMLVGRLPRGFRDEPTTPTYTVGPDGTTSKRKKEWWR
jgi:hypothetical protein